MNIKTTKILYKKNDTNANLSYCIQSNTQNTPSFSVQRIKRYNVINKNTYNVHIFKNKYIINHMKKKNYKINQMKIFKQKIHYKKTGGF